MKRSFVLACLFLLLSACSCSSAQKPEDLAEIAIRSFFDNLFNEKYSKAAAEFGGSYDTLIAMNPSIPPDDFAALWEQGCKVNGFQCLQVSTVSYQATTDDVFFFEVAFILKDGTDFLQKGCCGEDHPEQPAQTTFLVRVKKDWAGNYRVLTMPVYIP